MERAENKIIENDKLDSKQVEYLQAKLVAFLQGLQKNDKIYNDYNTKVLDLILAHISQNMKIAKQDLIVKCKQSDKVISIGELRNKLMKGE